jgi:hypothetical protein
MTITAAKPVSASCMPSNRTPAPLGEWALQAKVDAPGGSSTARSHAGMRGSLLTYSFGATNHGIPACLPTAARLRIRGSGRRKQKWLSLQEAGLPYADCYGAYSALWVGKAPSQPLAGTLAAAVAACALASARPHSMTAVQRQAFPRSPAQRTNSVLPLRPPLQIHGRLRHTRDLL